NENKLVIYNLLGNDIYLTDPGAIIFLDGFEELSVELNFRAKAKAFNQLVSSRSDLDIQSFIDGFIGWQNFQIDAVFTSSKGDYKTSDGSSLLLSGIYDFREIELPNSFYSQLQDSTIYDIAIVKKDKLYDFKINDLKNDFIQLDLGSGLIISEDFNYASITLVTSFKKELILDYIKGGLSQREANNNRLYDFLSRNLYPNQNMTVSFDLEPKSKNILDTIKNINVYSDGKFDSNYIFDDNKNPNYIIGIIDYKLEIENLRTKDVLVKGTIDLGDTEAFIRQINLN
ncbi:uncharacterized protein METZ01_LOCUS397813, partial [marine metagenome]